MSEGPSSGVLRGPSSGVSIKKHWVVPEKTRTPPSQKKMKILHSVDIPQRFKTSALPQQQKFPQWGGGGYGQHFPQLMKISIKLIITFGEGVSINCIYYTKVFCLFFCQIPFPYQYSHMQIICGKPGHGCFLERPLTM